MLTRKEIAKKSGLSSSNLLYYLLKLQIKPTGFMQDGRGVALTYSDDVLEKIMRAKPVKEVEK